LVFLEEKIDEIKEEGEILVGAMIEQKDLQEEKGSLTQKNQRN